MTSTPERLDLLKAAVSIHLEQGKVETAREAVAEFKAAVVREMKHHRQSSEGLLERLTKLEGEIQRLHDATEAALCSATRTTWVGSITPAATKSRYLPLATS